MIKFFRNIRKKLAAQNKVAAYLRYAIGEILLVVIGILIALQVNNWNQERKNLKEGKLIKQNINEEFIKNQDLLKESRNLNEAALSANKLLINLIGAEKPELEKYNLDSIFNCSLMAETYLPTSNSLMDIMQSGRTNLLNNTELKNTIQSWNAALDLFKEYYRLQANWYNNQYMPYMLPIISFKQMDIYNQNSWSGKSKLTTDYYTAFQDLKFENIVDNQLYLTEFLLKQLEKIEEYQLKIIELTNDK
jgi:hypothetical protein